MPGRRTTALAALVAALVCVGSVRAHGDPAADWLAAGTLFHSFDTRLSPSALEAVSTTIDRSKLAGYPVRVAVIERPADLGTLGRLWGRPEAYARHLAFDLRARYSGPILVVMPAGAGVARSDGAGEGEGERHVAGAVRVEPGGDGLAVAAIDAVAALAANAGHPFPPARLASAGSASGSSSALLVASVVLAVAFATSCLALVVVVRRSRAGTAS